MDSATYAGAASLVVRMQRVVCDGTENPACRWPRPPAAALNATGLILIDMDGQLLALDSSGATRRRYGADQQPRPYSSIAAVTSSGDTARVFDVRAWSWLSFDTAGHAIGRQGVRPDRLMRGFAARNGHLYAHLVPPGPSLGVLVKTQLLRLDGDTARLVASPEAPATQTDSSDLVPMTPMFAARPLWDVAGQNQVIYTTGETYTILLYETGGAPDRAIVVTGVHGRPVTPADVTREQLQRGTTSARGGGAVDQAFAVAASRAAATHAPITDLRALRGNAIVVRRAPDADVDSVRWDLWIGDRLAGAMRLGAVDHVIDGDSSRMLVISTTTPARPGRLAWLEIRPQPPRSP